MRLLLSTQCRTGGFDSFDFIFVSFSHLKSHFIKLSDIIIIDFKSHINVITSIY